MTFMAKENIRIMIHRQSIKYFNHLYDFISLIIINIIERRAEQDYVETIAHLSLKSL